jgi:dipeptidase E
MKFLLTSAGLTNQTIVQALEHLTLRPLDLCGLAFIPTAAHWEDGDKGWLIDDLNVCLKLFRSLDIVDIAAIPPDVWLPRLRQADVIVVGGGHTGHLIECINESGLADQLPELLKERVYVGISAGSMVTGPSLNDHFDSTAYLEAPLGSDLPKSLNLVPFQIRPHLNSPYFPQIRREKLEANPPEGEAYMLDDQSAVAVDGQKVSVVSEGEWFKFPAD